MEVANGGSAISGVNTSLTANLINITVLTELYSSLLSNVQIQGVSFKRIIRFDM